MGTTQLPENTAAYAIRFVRLATSIVLAHRLQQTGNAEQKARFARLSSFERKPMLEQSGSKIQEPPIYTHGDEVDKEKEGAE